MKKYQFKMKNTCSTILCFSLDGSRLYDVSFKDGCNGNLKAVSKLVEGMPAEQVVQLLKGTTCGKNSTSCADQLALAVETALRKG